MPRKSSIREGAAWTVTINDVVDTATKVGKRSNHVKTNKYNAITFIFVNLYEQFHRFANLFFLLIAIVALIPATQALNPETASAPLLSVLAVTAIRDWLEDRKRARSDREVNTKRCHLLKDKRFTDDEQWQNLQPGAIVRIDCDELVPADVLILSSSDSTGVCYVETVNLDGESNLKVREAHSSTFKPCGSLDGLTALSGEVNTTPPNNNLFKFDGNISSGTSKEKLPFSLSNILLRGTQLRQTEWVYGLILFTGHDTKVMQNVTKPRLKRTVIDYYLNVHILGVFLLMFVICTAFAIYASIWAREELPNHYYVVEDETPTSVGIIAFFAFLLLLHSLVPLSAYVSVELVRLAHAYFVSNDIEMYDETTDTPALARTSALSEEVGMVRYLLSDKTGTLTQNTMEFAGASIAGARYGVGSVEPCGPGEFSECPHSKPMRQFNDRALYEVLRNQPSTQVEMYMLCLALCNEVLPHSAEGQDIHEVGADKYNSQSPDETALVAAARDLGYSFYSRDNDGLLYVNVLGERRVYQHLDAIEFSSTRKRMTVIVQRVDVVEDHVYVLVKGADEVILELVNVEEPVYTNTVQHLSDFASTGLRTLCLGYKLMPKKEFLVWKDLWRSAAVQQITGTTANTEVLAAEMESSLTLLGASAVEDLLQERAPETIANLKRANIAVWVLTGDKLETAVSIGCSINLLTANLKRIVLQWPAEGFSTVQDLLLDHLKKLDLPSPLVEGKVDKSIDLKLPIPNTEFAIVVDGLTLQVILKDEVSTELFAALSSPSTGVVCCRCAPLQKAQVVKMVRRRFRAVTMAIGDGANDVSMIKEANIGVGISGKEGRQAVLASDYAIAKFRFLERLLLVHGRWSYNRITWLILYFFYKNYTYILVNMWFGWFCVGTAQTIYDQRYVMLYNVIFTSVPGLIAGMTDQDVSATTALKFPELYIDSQRNALFGYSKYWLWILDSFYQSFVVFGIGLLASSDVAGSVAQPWDLWESGTVMFTSVIFIVNLKILLDSPFWNRPLILSIVISLLAYVAFLLIYQAILPEVVPSFFAIYHLAGDAMFWFAILLSVVVALAPGVIFKLLRVYFYPRAADILREQERRMVTKQRHKRTHTLTKLRAHGRAVLATAESDRLPQPSPRSSRSTDSAHASNGTNNGANGVQTMMIAEL